MKIIVENRKARFQYHLEQFYEAGLVLTGSEVKSLREGRVNLGDSYAIIKNDELYLLNCHISPYEPAAQNNHEPLRTRKLLLKRREIETLIGLLKTGGLTLIPTKLYFKEGRAKAELALARGKKLFDKRETIKQREASRKMASAMKRRN